MIDKILKGDAESIAIEYENEKITYGELKRKVTVCCSFLEEHNLAQGSRLCLEVNDPVQYFVLLLACFVKRVVVCPLSTTYSDEYIQTILDIFKPNAVLKDDCQILHMEQDLSKVPPEFSSMALVTFTSGTTGTPKGVCHSLDSLLKCSEAFNKHNSLDSETRMMHVMPRFYMAGILNTFLSPLLAGGTVVISAPFSAQNAPVLFKKYFSSKANAIWLSPSMLLLSAKMAKDPESIAWVSETKSKIFVGTAPLPAKSKDFFQKKFLCEVLESYGTSELLFISCVKAGTADVEGVGQMLEGVELSFEEDDEILIDSPWSMIGYLNATGSGKNTGDLGKLDNGCLIITGRKKDLIIKGGQNISPRYIEEAALASCGIEEAAVIGESHPFWGEVPILYVVTNNSYVEQEFREFLSSKLSREQYPEKICLIDSFPKTVTGKIVKNDIVASRVN